MQENTERATRVLMGKESLTAAGSVKPLGLEDKVNFYIHSFLAQEKERISVGLMWKLSGHENYDEYEAGQISTPNWQALKEQADREFAAQCSNDLAMRDKLYESKYKPILKSRKNSETKRSFASSPEYDDLRLFLAICADQASRRSWCFCRSTATGMILPASARKPRCGRRQGAGSGRRVRRAAAQLL